jgi:hypothetical protein
MTCNMQTTQGLVDTSHTYCFTCMRALIFPHLPSNPCITSGCTSFSAHNKPPVLTSNTQTTQEFSTCSYCRIAHRKCDKQRPCGTCKKKAIECKDVQKHTTKKYSGLQPILPRIPATHLTTPPSIEQIHPIIPSPAPSVHQTTKKPSLEHDHEILEILIKAYCEQE